MNSPSTRRLVPAGEARAELTVANSRFIATLAPAFSVSEARAFIARIRSEFSDATHNVSAYRIGHANATIAHCNDDGEPPGTAGRPALTALQKSGLGDVVVVVTRYFGGTQLGTGGLVRAYGDAVRTVLEIAPRAERVLAHTALVAMPYTLYERLRALIISHRGQIMDETFSADVMVTFRVPVARWSALEAVMREVSAGTIHPMILETADTIVPLPSV